MQNLKIILVSILMILVCTSCSSPESQEPVNMDELLKIRTWLMDDELEGTGRWGYVSLEEQLTSYKGNGDGYWIPDDEKTQVANEDVFELEALEVGVPRTMAPMSMNMKREHGDSINYANLILDIEFDGLVKITKIEPNDDSIQLRYTVNGPAIEANDISIQAPCIIEVCPLGKVPASNSIGFYVTRDTIVGKEYILQIQGCSMGGDPIVTAQVKLTAIPDPEYPWETVHSGRYGELNEMGEERTRFCSVELISYTYSEMYILGGAVGNID